jgi:hypothetical protein
VIKEFHYRGATHTFSNRYHFGGGTPADSTHWTTFSDNVVAAEKAIFHTFASYGARIIETVGYAGGSEIPVFTKIYTPVDGTATGTGFNPPGDVAALIRYATPDRSSKNHPIYCFNYYHAIWQSDAVGGQDAVAPSQATALGTYATAWLSGFSDGTNVLRRSRPNGTVCTGSFVEPLLTHRDLPR